MFRTPSRTQLVKAPVSEKYIHLFRNMHLSLLLPLLFSYSYAAYCLPIASCISESSPLRQMPATISPPFERVDPTLPPVSAGQAPKCSVLVLQRDFAHTVDSPPAYAKYAHPKSCPAPWTRIVLELSASASDVQKDRIAAVWIDGAEILRTSTPLPTEPNTYWRVEKDVTRYAAVLTRMSQGRQSCGIISMMLRNSNENFPGVYSVNLTLHFYRGSIGSAENLGCAAHPTVKGHYREAADRIISISQENGHRINGGFWFRIDNTLNVSTATVTIPRNTYRAVLEIFSSYHANDELWYSNPLRPSYLKTGFGRGAENGGFRQVYATVDGRFVGGHVPYAVLYPSSINPYFWSPVAAIGAFDMPSYDVDITPFLGLMLDGQAHEIGLGVKDGRAYWLLTANLHVWTDAWSDAVEGGVVEYAEPELRMSQQAAWGSEDGQSEVVADGLARFAGWVSSSEGNLTTTVTQKVTFKSQVQVQNRGTFRQVEMVNKEQLTIEVAKGSRMLRRVEMFTEAPLQVQTSSTGTTGEASLERTRMYHQLQEIMKLTKNQVTTTSELTDRQEAEGSTLVHSGRSTQWGSADTKSTYKYRDEKTCYQRILNTQGGAVTDDHTSPSCATAADF